MWGPVPICLFNIYINLSSAVARSDKLDEELEEAQRAVREAEVAEAEAVEAKEAAAAQVRKSHDASETFDQQGCA